MNGRLVSEYQKKQNQVSRQNISAEEYRSIDKNAFDILKPVDGVDAVQWQKLRRLGQTVYPTNSQFGKPTTFLAGEKYLYIGTQSADVLVFDYDQHLITSMRNEQLNSVGYVTSLNYNHNETHVCVGYSLGFVSVYSIDSLTSSSKHIYTAEPLKTLPKYTETHLLGSKINHVAFLTSHSQTVISVDNHGIVCLHKRKQTVLKPTLISKRILGSYLEPLNVLSVCSWYGHLAILSSTSLNILSCNDTDFSTVLEIPVLVDVSSGFVAFNTATKELVYTINSSFNSLQQLSNGELVARSAYTHFDDIVSVSFLSADMVLLVTSNLDFLINDSFLFSLPLPPSSGEITSINSLILCMGKFEFYCGQITSWSDRILGLLNKEDPEKAVDLACGFYEYEGNLEILGFPPQSDKRRLAVRTAFPDFALTALRFALEFDNATLQQLVPAVVRGIFMIKPQMLLRAWELINADSPKVNERYGTWKTARSLFLSSVIEAVKQLRVSRLPASIYRELVIQYPDEPEIFYNLDLSNLDLDLAFKVVKDEEVRIYLEANALKDYISPLKSSMCATYLAYTLTGRTFPTGSPAYLYDAKMQIYTQLFLCFDKNNKIDTNLLVKIIKADEEGVFEAFNEAFEDSYLNENHDINRQVILNTLLSLEGKLKTDCIYIFVAENYPKYSQFLVLPETTLTWVIDGLLSSKYKKEECQIALLSLLTTYKPHDMTEFVDRLTSVGYTLVIEHIFRRSNRLHDLVNLKLNSDNDSEVENIWGVLKEAMVNNQSETKLFVTTNFKKLVNLNPAAMGEFSIKFDLQFWDLLKGSDAHTKLGFMDAYFQYINKYGGLLPDQFICTEFIGMICDDHEKLMHNLNSLFIGPDDLSLPMLVDSLIANNQIDALALLLCRKDRKQEAMIYIANYIPSLSSPEQTDELTRYMDFALSICLEVSSEDLWKRLLETSVEMKNKNILKMIVQSLTCAKNTDIVNLVKGVMNNTSKSGSIPIISLIYSDLKRQEEALKVLYEILSEESRNEVYEDLRNRVSGWTVPVSSECEVCGKKIVGLGIDASELYETWENLMLDNIEISDQNALVLFRCNHFYHISCLSRMNGVDKDRTRHCIVCK